MRLLAVFLILSGLAGGFSPRSTLAQAWSPPLTVFVPTTGHTADGLFLDIWRSERGFLGDPITEEIRPRSGFTAAGEADVVQYYEHMALIYLPDETPDNQVQTLDLGQQALDRAKSAGTSLALNRALERTVCSPIVESACLNVVATGHTLRDSFFAYWQEGDAAAWFGPPLTEAFTAPDGTRVQYFESGILRQTSTGAVEPLPLGRIAAREAQVATAPVPQSTAIPTYDEVLFIPPPEASPVEDETTGATDWSFGPGPQQGAWKEVVVSLSAQTMWAYEGGELAMSSLVSTGTGNIADTLTPTGFFSVLAKFDVQTMEGTISGEQYRVEDVPYVMYFDNDGDALHGTYWHNNFGTPMSHGCVNLPMDIAAWMYDWAPVGTAVSVVN
jgi:hypothetical protein